MYHYAKVIRGPHWYDGNLRTGRTEKDPAGEVTVRTLSAAELAEFNARVPPVCVKRTLIETDGERLLRTQHKGEQHKKEENSVAKYTKEEYLQLRAQGKSRAQIAAQWGMQEKSLVGNWYPKWGLRKEDEEEALKVEAPSMSGAPSASPVDKGVDKPKITYSELPCEASEPGESTEEPAGTDSTEDLQYAPAIASLYLPIDCPRCGTRHFVSMRLLSNSDPDRAMWWAMCLLSQEPILAGVDVRPI